MSEKVWFYVEGDAQLGPVTREELAASLRQRLPRETLVWREGMPDWVSAEDVTELGVRPASPPPPPAPPPPPPPRLSPQPRAPMRAVPAAAAAAEPSGEAPSYNPLVVWRRCFSWGGRFDRAEFAIAYFGQIALTFGLFLGIGVVGALLSGPRGAPDESVQMLTGAAALLVLPFTVIIGVGAAVRRLHDLGQNGWLALLMLVPCINFLMVIYLVAVPGTAQAGVPRAATSPAVPALVIGVVVVVLLVPIIGIVAAIAIPSLLRARLSANEAGAIGDVRTVISAEAAYQSANSGFYGTITCLGTPSGCLGGYNGPPFLDAALAQPMVTARGYQRRWFEVPSRARPGSIDQFCYSAMPAQPNQTGIRSFGGDSSGVVGASPVGAACCSERGLDLAACPPLP